MEELQILHEIREEIKQIINNYETSYNITRGGITLRRTYTEGELFLLRERIVKATLIYRTALRECERQISVLEDK